MEHPPGARRLVPIREAMRYARWSKTKVYDMIAAEKIRAYKDGARTMVDLNTIDDYQATLPRK
jgi:excisionase family DNA binding protein